MNRNDILIIPATLGILVLTMSLALAQSGKSAKQEKAPPEEKNPYAEKSGFRPYSEANLKFDILEAQIQTLRKKMQLQSKSKAEQTKEWDAHYEKVKHHIEAWDDFVDSYNME